jgi:hypothetical protein
MRFSAAFVPLLPLLPLRKPTDRAASARHRAVITPAVRPLPETPPVPAQVVALPARPLVPELLLDLDQRVRLSGEW